MIQALAMGVIGAAAGLALGSFAATAGLRMVEGESALRGRSRCDHCRVELGFARTIPVLSHLRQGGSCADCGGRIDPAHMAGELAGAIVVVSAVSATDGLRAVLLISLGLVLVAACAADLKAKILPDIFTVSAAVLSFALAWQSGGGAVLEGLLAAILSFAALQLVRTWSMRKGRPAGLGFGDVKLGAALAIWLGALTPWMVLCASVVGLGVMAIARPADGRLPFGPALGLGAWAVGLGMEIGSWPALR